MWVMGRSARVGSAPIERAVDEMHADWSGASEAVRCGEEREAVVRYAREHRGTARRRRFRVCWATMLILQTARAGNLGAANERAAIAVASAWRRADRDGEEEAIERWWDADECDSAEREVVSSAATRMTEQARETRRSCSGTVCRPRSTPRAAGCMHRECLVRQNDARPTIHRGIS